MTTRTDPIEQLVAQGFEGQRGSLEQQVRELADREEIREIVARYAQRVSHRQSPGDLFTDEGALIIDMVGFPRQEIRGREALEAMFTATAARPAMNMPCVHNQLITVRGDEAWSTSWIELYLGDDANADGRAFAGAGWYEDHLRRLDGRWKFVSRRADVRIVGAAQRTKPITQN